ncbi:MAG: FtsW/RodA/SpoVE family cell cycle protein [Chthonomonadales bacterium]|nr:FtsW/RodA/SpoVE family cell cycle protein [Chthonomonadales bacterium]
MYPLFKNHPPQSEASPSSQIEDYLDHLCALLIHKRTYQQRLAIREEVRSHLLVLAAGHEELGSNPVEAIQAAIHQFGDAKQIGRSLLSEYRKPFVLNRQLLWMLMPVAVGGVLGSIAFVTMDLLVRQMGMTT